MLPQPGPASPHPPRTCPPRYPGPRRPSRRLPLPGSQARTASARTGALDLGRVRLLRRHRAVRLHEGQGPRPAAGGLHRRGHHTGLIPEHVHLVRRAGPGTTAKPPPRRTQTELPENTRRSLPGGTGTTARRRVRPMPPTERFVWLPVAACEDLTPRQLRVYAVLLFSQAQRIPLDARRTRRVPASPLRTACRTAHHRNGGCGYRGRAGGHQAGSPSSAGPGDRAAITISPTRSRPPPPPRPGPATRRRAPPHESPHAGRPRPLRTCRLPVLVKDRVPRFMADHSRSRKTTRLPDPRTSPALPHPP